MERIHASKHVNGQQALFLWGSLCGFCQEQKPTPVCFLAGKMDKLTIEEKADVIEWVQANLGEVRETRQTRKVFDVIRGRNSEG